MENLTASSNTITPTFDGNKLVYTFPSDVLIDYNSITLPKGLEHLMNEPDISKIPLIKVNFGDLPNTNKKEKKNKTIYDLLDEYFPSWYKFI